MTNTNRAGSNIVPMSCSIWRVDVSTGQQTFVAAYATAEQANARAAAQESQAPKGVRFETSWR